MKEVPPERTGWRDAELSRRHRLYGFDLPCVDVDHLILEYSSAMPKAIVEYKHECAEVPDHNNASYRALKVLSTMARIPFIECRYARDFSWWKAIPYNTKALEYLPNATEFDENGWVEFLYRLRGIPMPTDLQFKAFSPVGV